jgi:hypothetical protein
MLASSDSAKGYVGKISADFLATRSNEEHESTKGNGLAIPCN